MDVALGGSGRWRGGVVWAGGWWGVGGGDAGVGVHSDHGGSCRGVWWDWFGSVVRGGDDFGARADVRGLRGGR